jgi:hypothetical protein
VFAMTVTALPMLKAYAAECQCAPPLKCCWNYDHTVTSPCAADDDVCCASQDNPWSCPNGHNCLGDGGCS